MKTRTDPVLVRKVLADAAKTNGHAAAKKHGINTKTVYRWLRYRADHPAWPTPTDVRVFADEAARLTDIRAQKSAARLDWSKRVYVARGLMLVGSLGTTRRLRALYAIGWTGPELGRRLNLSGARISHLIAGTRPKVHRNTADRVAALYDEISMVVPLDPEVLEVKHTRIHDRQRRQSAEKGWAPPLAWDDIDDPDESPTRWQYAPIERSQRLDELLAEGADLWAVLRDLDITQDTFQAWCGRHGRSSDYVRLAEVAHQRVKHLHFENERHAS